MAQPLTPPLADLRTHELLAVAYQYPGRLAVLITLPYLTSGQRPGKGASMTGMQPAPSDHGT